MSSEMPTPAEGLSAFEQHQADLQQERGQEAPPAAEAAQQETAPKAAPSDWEAQIAAREKQIDELVELARQERETRLRLEGWKSAAEAPRQQEGKPTAADPEAEYAQLVKDSQAWSGDLAQSVRQELPRTEISDKDSQDIVDLLSTDPVKGVKALYDLAHQNAIEDMVKIMAAHGGLTHANNVESIKKMIQDEARSRIDSHSTVTQQRSVMERAFSRLYTELKPHIYQGYQKLPPEFKAGFQNYLDQVSLHFAKQIGGPQMTTDALVNACVRDGNQQVLDSYLNAIGTEMERRYGWTAVAPTTTAAAPVNGGTREAPGAGLTPTGRTPAQRVLPPAAGGIDDNPIWSIIDES